MSLALDDIVRITSRSTFLGQNMLNVWFYQAVQLGTLVSYEEVVSQWRAEYVTHILPLTADSCMLTEVIIENLTNEVDIEAYPFDDVGTGGEDYSPSFSAWGFILNRATKLTRHGHKRIGGLTESMLSGNAPVAGMLTSLNGAAAWMGADFVKDPLPPGDPIFTLRPVIIGRTEQAPAGSGKYVLDLSKVNNVLSAQFRGLTTQVTRKMGRGN